jgi:hypothetical protein
MPPLIGAELEEAIAKPAKLQGYQLEMDCWEPSCKMWVKRRAAYRLLQFALTELWEQRDRKPIS